MLRVLKRLAVGDHFGAMAVTIGRQAISTVLQISVALMVARELGPAGQGVLSLALAFQQLAALVFGFGFGSAKTYYSSFGAISEEQSRQYERKLIMIAASGTIVVMSAMQIASAEILRGVTPIIASAIVVSSIVSILLEWALGALLSRQEYVAYNKILLAQTLSYVMMAAVIYLCGVLSVPVVLGAYIASNLIATLAARRAVRGSPLAATGNPPTLGGMLSYGSKNMAADAVTMLNYRLSFFISNATMGNALTGVFALAVSLVEKLWVVSQGVATVLLPKMAADNHGGTKSGARINLAIAFAVMLVTLAGGLILLVVLRMALLKLLGAPYAGLIQVTIWLLPGCVAWAGVRVVAAQVSALGAPHVNLFVTITCLFANVSLIYIAYDKLDPVAMAKISTISYVVSLSIILIYGRIYNKRRMDA